jgi:hypothetical protein
MRDIGAQVVELFTANKWLRWTVFWLGAFEDIARANGITKAELLRRLIQALVETMKRGKAGR